MLLLGDFKGTPYGLTDLQSGNLTTGAIVSVCVAIAASRARTKSIPDYTLVIVKFSSMAIKSPKKICVSVTDENGVLLNSCEYNLTKIERFINKRSGHPLLSRDIALIGDDAGDIVHQEIIAALRRRNQKT